jgi:diacylglycerol kinase-like protein
MLAGTAMNQPARQLSRYGWQPADPPGRPVLFINPRSGAGKAARTGLAERAREAGIESVILAPGQDLAALARDAVTGGADALGMAGGDGSLAVVAAVAAAGGILFVCIPAGTRNHFALDVGPVHGYRLDARQVHGGPAGRGPIQENDLAASPASQRKLRRQSDRSAMEVSCESDLGHQNR